MMQRCQIFDFKSADEIELQSSKQISVKYLKSTNQMNFNLNHWRFGTTLSFIQTMRERE